MKKSTLATQPIVSSVVSEIVSQPVVSSVAPPRKIGRPPGSKNSATKECLIPNEARRFLNPDGSDPILVQSEAVTGLTVENRHAQEAHNKQVLANIIGYKREESSRGS